MNRPNWDVILIRVCFVLSLSALAAVLHPFHLSAAVATPCAACVAAAILALEFRLTRAGIKQLVAGWLGLFAGALLGAIFVFLIPQAWAPQASTALFIRVAVPLLAAYLGLAARLGQVRSIAIGTVGLT